MQANKIIKRLLKMTFNNPNFVSMRKNLNYKNVDKIKTLLTKSSYIKVIWQTKSLSIYLVIVDIPPKKYLMYYFDIKLVI